MRFVFLSLVVSWPAFVCAGSLQGPPFPSVAQIKSLSAEQAREGRAVELTGVVTQTVPEWWGFSLQDGTGGVYVSSGGPLAPQLVPGVTVEVQGRTGPGNFAPMVAATRIRVLGPGAWPRPAPVTWRDLATGACDNEYVEVQGVVRSVAEVAPPAWEWRALGIRLDVGGNLLWAYLRSGNDLPLGGLIDSTVRVRGVCVVFSNSQRHFQGISLIIPRAADVRILQPGSRDPFDLPAQPIGRVFGYRMGAVSFHRVKVQGAVTLQSPAGVYVQEGKDGVFVRTGSPPPLQVGDRVEAVGFPAPGRYSTELDDALIRVVGKGAPPPPKDMQAGAVLARVENAPASPDAVLLRIAGRLVDRTKSAGGETLILQDGAHVFTARLSARDGAGGLPDFARPGSRIAVTGICSVEADERGLPRSFELLMRSGGDLALLARAPWLTEKAAVRGASVLLVLAVASLVWLALLRRRVAQQTRTIRAQLEREAALEKRYSELVENASDLVYVRDLDGALLQVNHGMEELTGYSRHELLAMNVLDLLLPEDRERARRELQLPPGEDHRIPSTEWTFRAKDGRALTVESKQRFLPGDGLPGRVECIGRDVTARKQAQAEAERAREELRAAHDDLERRVRDRTAELISAGQSLHSSEQRFRLAVENFPFAFVIYDRERRIQFMNERGAQLAGATAQAVVGRRDEDLFPDSVTNGYLPALRLCVETLTPQAVECGLDLPAGRFHLIINFVPVMNERGELAQILGIHHDITERKRLEEQLQHSQRLESIGQLAGGVAHDFNNLLTVIGGYAQIVSADPELSERFRDSIDQIASASDRAASLTRQLLIFSRRQAAAPKLIAINDVVRNFEKMLRRVIPEDIEFSLALDPQAGSMRADPGHIEQVLMNLVVNAKDAMPDGGRLTIETAPFHVDDSFAGGHVDVQPGGYVLLNITDTGAGMPPEVKTRIFEPFFTTKEQGKGTGLGLSTVYGIVRQCGGAIFVYSEPGLGSSFKILFPLAEAEGSRQQSSAARRAPLSSGDETILLVEDEPAIRKFVSEVLRRHGYVVVEARNGLDALQAAARHSGAIHLLLTDIVMPEMGGHDLEQRFAELYPRTPVLHMSGYNERWFKRENKGAFIEKPFTASALLVKVREVLNREEPGSVARPQS